MKFSVFGPQNCSNITLYLCGLPFGEFMFIKHGDGKILDVVDGESLTEEQKKAVKQVSKQLVKESDENDVSSKKKQGN